MISPLGEGRLKREGWLLSPLGQEVGEVKVFYPKGEELTGVREKADCGEIKNLPRNEQYKLMYRDILHYFRLLHNFQ